MREKTPKGSKRQVGKRSGEEDLWQKEQYVQNHETGTNSLGLSRSKGVASLQERESGKNPREVLLEMCWVPHGVGPWMRCSVKLRRYYSEPLWPKDVFPNYLQLFSKCRKTSHGHNGIQGNEIYACGCH